MKSQEKKIVDERGGETMKEAFLTVIDVARRCRCSVELVRFYERKGTLKSMKTVGGMRLFRSVDVESFARDREAKRVGATGVQA